MADLIKAIILAIIEGLTEFIPVSSTAHLLLIGKLMEFNVVPAAIFEITIQLGAILAVCIFYRKKLFNVAFSLHNKKESRNFVFNITLAFLPAAIIGFLFYSNIKSIFDYSIFIIANLFIGGLIIIFIEKKLKPIPKYKNLDEISKSTAFKIGLFQCLALIPGTSRAGSTIIGSLLLGLDRKTAAEFSFFLAIPTMLLATLYNIYKNYHLISLDHVTIILVGFIVSFIVAYLTVNFVISFIEKNGFIIFGYWRIFFAILMLLFYL